ncbi:hybrid sensor histidine kinase/response regulator [Aquabacterium sp. OR-4]|uniref:hybrid sensor histidine kinase/response regulator n=1 Tax=Aquabacterium sp. OR-4 TaxID=2978127 RepID=UPI0028C772B0|nr:response regulator [Aquabacterium sp. OR-4]MDT7838653.1 response regulator [Aquabacterium sp. OR-4]
MLVPPPRAADDATLQAVITHVSRLAAVRATELLDTPAEDSFDRLTRLATRLIGAPVSFMTLVDEGRDFYKSHSGFAEPLASVRQLEGRTFCHFGLVCEGPLVLDDVTAYPGFREVPTVRSLGIRAYAGVPLITDDGLCLGSFCAVDFAPRQWREQDIALLGELAHAAMREIVLRQALRRAEAASRARSAFLSNIGHEIRTPMHAIVGLNHLMARDNRDPLQRERLGQVDAAARRLMQLINDLQDLSRIESGRLQLEPAEFALDAMFSACFEQLASQAQGKGLELVLDTHGLPRRLRGDAQRLRQALLHLLSNGVKFTTQGSVRLHGELLREAGARVLLRLEVRDTGRGIAPAAQARLFDGDAPADEHRARPAGSGLGLLLTRHLAQLMGGEVGVASTPGQGSRFWFTAWLERAADQVEADEPVRLQSLRALVVDDLPEALASLGRQLGQLGLQVLGVPGGREALQVVQQAMLRGTPFDLLLIDRDMQPLDGLATLRALRKALGDGMPPAILMASGEGPAQAWQPPRGLRCEGVLSKPVLPSALHRLLMQVLRTPQPVAAAQLTGRALAEAALRRGHAGRRVLVAEDNPINQSVLYELLRLAGLEVLLASDGAQALALAASQPVDLLLLGAQMPVLDGLATARRLRPPAGAPGAAGPGAAGLGAAGSGAAGPGVPPASPRGARPAIVIMSADAFGPDRQAWHDAGIDDHLAKPVDPESLYQTLLRWLPPAP